VELSAWRQLWLPDRFNKVKQGEGVALKVPLKAQRNASVAFHLTSHGETRSWSNVFERTLPMRRLVIHIHRLLLSENGIRCEDRHAGVYAVAMSV
jgi:hypothetical protein